MVRVKFRPSMRCGAQSTHLAEGPDVDTNSAVLGAPVASEPTRADMREALDVMLRTLVESGGSDLHLTVGAPPMIRVHGDLRPLPDYPQLTPRDTAGLVHAVLNDTQWAEFENTLEIDIAYSLSGISRFRVN